MEFNKAGKASYKNNLDSEKSLLERFEAKYKKTYFWALFVLLKEEDSSILLTMISALIMFLQLQIFPFHPNVRLPGENSGFHSSAVKTAF